MQLISRLCCVTARNVRLVPHHAGRQLELGTAKDELFELLRRILAVKMRIQGFLTIPDPFNTVLTPAAANHKPMCQNRFPICGLQCGGTAARVRALPSAERGGEVWKVRWCWCCWPRRCWPL